MSVAVRKWLSEYKSLLDEQRTTYASTLRQNDDLIQELYDLFEDDLSHEVIDPVCHQLFDFYRSGNIDLQRFTLELVPALVWTYLFTLTYSDKKKCGGIEACLLGIYNLEVVDENGKPKQKTVVIPSLASPSLFHEPPSLSSLVLTESALTRYHSDQPRTISIGPLPPVESINAHNRLLVLTYIMNRYSADIVSLSSRSHNMLCRMCSRLSKTGFDELCENWSPALDTSDSTSTGTPRRGVTFVEDLRIPLSSGLLVELLSAVYYVMFNGQARDGQQALEDIHWRASYELYADVILVTSAIRNSLQFNPSGQPKDIPMGISIALSPTQGNPAFSKDAITNASFRARKLPEDIDVQDNVDSASIQLDLPNQDGVDTEVPCNGQRSVSESKPSPIQPKSGSSGKGPLKSIMKKREERAREKGQRKELDPSSASAAAPKRGSHFKEFLELHVPKSPRHSVSMSGMASASSPAATDAAGHPVDASAIQLIIRGGNAANRQSLDSDTLSTGRASLSRSSTAALNEATTEDNALSTRNNVGQVHSWSASEDSTNDREEDDPDMSMADDEVLPKTQF